MPNIQNSQPQKMDNYYNNKKKKIYDLLIGLICSAGAFFVTAMLSQLLFELYNMDSSLVIFVALLIIGGAAALALKRKYILLGLLLAYPIWVLFFLGWVIVGSMACSLGGGSCSMP